MPIVSLKANKNLEFEVNEGEILFDALDNRGEKLPHGCLAGSCGACRVEILEGAENLKPASAIEQDTVDDIRASYERKNGAGSLDGRTIRLACRAKVLGDITFQPLKK